ncbi:MAG: FHA domain-containing protein [Candidatus Melainabacteria bacterium]|nr:FHA domain-containing protein [Candidatus Melainabacteria bacterium]
MANNETASPPTAYLVDLVSNRKIPITTPRCRVGRDDLNDIVISGDQSISRFHFILTFEDGKYLVQDAKSRHGTFLNGNQISTPEPINDGDVLKIGVSLFWFVIEQPAEEGGDLSPVDTDKIKKEEINVARSHEGSMDISLPSGDLSSTQEIDIPSAEAMAKVEAEMEAEARRKRENSEKEADQEDEEEEDEPPESKKEDEKSEEEEPESAPEKIEADSEESKEEEVSTEKSEEEKSEEVKSEEVKSEEVKSEEEKSRGEEEEEEEEEEDPVAASVKSLLEPLHDDIAASKAMIDEALKKAQIDAAAREEEERQEKRKAEPEAEKEEEKEAPEPVQEAEAEAEQPEEKPEEKPEEEPEEKAENEDQEPEEAAAKEPDPVEAKSEEEPEAANEQEESDADEEKASKNETLEKFAGIIEDSDDSREEAPGDEIVAEDADTSATNGTDTSMAKTVEKMVSTNVPDWCKRYFSDELKGLNKELEELNEQIRKTESRIKEIEGQTALTKGLRNTLLTSEGDDLIEACKQVLGLCGWKATQSDEDKNEILLEHDDDRVAIARIIWTKTSAERSHLGQLSISQTRYWCEKGTEPKGVLIVGKLSEGEPKDPSESAEEELTDYAAKKNVCLMSTLQLLAVYRDLALGDGSAKELRKAIHDCKGWLEGYMIEPGTEILEDEDDKDGKGSKSLSSLLSA